jgi:hypothetical protein
VTFWIRGRYSCSADRSRGVWEVTAKVSDVAAEMECRNDLSTHVYEWICDQVFAWEKNEMVLVDKLILWEENAEMGDPGRRAVVRIHVDCPFSKYVD